MKRKKTIFSLLGLMAIGLIPMSNITVSANAGIDFGDNFSLEYATYRPSEGFLNEGDWLKNPFEANSYFGNSPYYSRGKTHVQNKKYSLYGTDFYYYEPTGYDNAQYEAVPENKYAHISYQDYYKEDSYIKAFGNSGNRNFSKWQGAINNYDFQAWNKQQPLSKYYEYATNYDSKMGSYGQWRFMGYNMNGGSATNIFFPPDGVSSKMNHVSNVNILWTGIHGYVEPWGATVPHKYKVLKTRFDDERFYNKKVNAIQEMMDFDNGFNTGRIRNFVNNSEWTTKSWKDYDYVTAEEWAECLSLKTHPTLDTPILNGYLPAGNGEVSYSTFIAPSSKTLDADMEVNEIRAYRSNELVGRYTRDGGSRIYNHKITPGNKYRFDYVVKNTGKNTLNISPALLDTGFSVNRYSSQNGHSEKFPENSRAYNKTLSSNESRRLAPGETATFSRTERVPDDVRTGWKASSYINEKHVKNNDNAFPDNDWGFLRFNEVELGDVSAEDIYYEDVRGNKTNVIIPGEKYKVCFEFKYTGPTIDEPKNLHLQGNVKRYLPQEGGTSESKPYNFYSRVYLTRGMSNLVYKTELIDFEQPAVDVSSRVSISDGTINSSSENDNYSSSFKGSYDYSISNVSTLPSNDKPIKDGNITIGVKYDINLNSPSYASHKEFDITSHITLPNGIAVSVTDHVQSGLNKDIVHEIQLPVSKITSGYKNLPINVIINADKKKWEDDLWTQSNNKGVANFQIMAPNDPTKFANGTGCPLNTSNSNNWNLNHRISSFRGENVSYNTFRNSKSYNFYNYNFQYNDYNSSKNYNESYKIDNVLFKSKFTTDNKFGTNGWVDLTNASKKEKAKIKAGYGYELQMDVIYKNNVFGTQPKSTWNRSYSLSNGLTVSNIQTPANINNDIYVRTSDGKTLSATGMYGTIQAFDSKVLSNSNDEVKVRYSMKTKNNNGINEPLKIFVDENSKDGSYGINVFTPTMKGVGSGVKKNDLCDSKKLSYKVQGSMYDDNIDHIVQ